jgi:xanthine dehydrogenase YagT iron-sulfur-binding subunit
MTVCVSVTVNGTEVQLEVEPRLTLADALRQRLHLTGTHLGCEHGVCGACTVLVNGSAMRSCLMFAVQADGADVVTVEGLGRPDDLHPLQRAFSERHGLQCGFCTPGFLMSAYELLQDRPEVAASGEVARHLSGVLCRCTGYRGIVEAVRSVARDYPEGVPEPKNLGRPLVPSSEGLVPTRRAAPLDRAVVAVETELRPPEGEATAEIEVRRDIEAPLAEVWGLVADLPRLSRCLPGGELTEETGPDTYRGRALVHVGPMEFRFEGAARLYGIDEDTHKLRVVGSGTDVGGAKARVDLQLSAQPNAQRTTLTSNARLFLTGRAAQFGRFILQDVAANLFEDFCNCLEGSIKGEEAVPGARLRGTRLLRRALFSSLRRWWTQVARRIRAVRK